MTLILHSHSTRSCQGITTCITLPSGRIKITKEDNHLYYPVAILAQYICNSLIKSYSHCLYKKVSACVFSSLDGFLRRCIAICCRYIWYLMIDSLIKPMIFTMQQFLLHSREYHFYHDCLGEDLLMDLQFGYFTCTKIHKYEMIKRSLNYSRI